MPCPERVLGDGAHGHDEGPADEGGGEAGQRRRFSPRPARRRRGTVPPARVPRQPQRAQVHASGEGGGGGTVMAIASRTTVCLPLATGVRTAVHAPCVGTGGCA